MKLFIGGVRGGQSIADKQYATFGGETTCYMVEGTAGERVILDAGTGLRIVEARLREEPPPFKNILFLFSHFHLDHVSGLPSFTLLHDEEWTLEFASRIIGESTAEDVLDSFIRPPLWPLSWDDMKANRRYRIFDAESMEAPSQYGDLSIRWCPLEHRGGATAFRIDEVASASSVVVATDVEWSLSSPEDRAAFLGLCTQPGPTHTLIMDGQYSAENYPAHRGWGHSTWEEVVALAQEAGVERLYITHHDLNLTDAEAEKREEAIKHIWPAAALTRQGALLDIGLKT